MNPRVVLVRDGGMAHGLLPGYLLVNLRTLYIHGSVPDIES